MKDQILEAIKYKELDLNDYTEAHELNEALDYDGRLHEIIDGMIDIVNYNIRKWAVDNWDYVEQAIEEGLTDLEDLDYHSMIQSGQFCYYTEQANEALEEIWEEHEAKQLEVK